MFPAFAAYDTGNLRLFQATSISKFLLCVVACFIFFPNFFNLVICQFHLRVKDAGTRLALCPPFLRAVTHIIFLSSDKEMRRIAARWIVARVTNHDAFFNFSKSVDVGKAASVSLPFVFPSAVREVTVTVMIFRRFPRPTFFFPLDVYLAPKPFHCAANNINLVGCQV